jgi:hypothetical protein
MFRWMSAAIVCVSFLHAADTEDTVRKSAQVSSATRVVVAAEFGGIRVKPGSSQNVDVEVYFRGDPPARADFDRMLRDFKLDVTQEGSDIRVTGTFQNGWKPESAFRIVAFGGRHPFCRNGRCLEYSTWLREVEYRVSVPATFSANLDTSGGAIAVSDLKGEVNAHTSGGALSFNHIDGPVNGRTSGGPITIEGGKGPAMVHTSGGPIRISEVGGDVDASTSGGPISIERAAGRVRARTSGGSIDISEAMGAIDASTSGGGVMASLMGQPKEDCRLDTSGGSIRVRLGKGVHVNLDASTSGGHISTDFGVANTDGRRRSELHEPLNGGGPLLYLHTSGGGISVTHQS